MKRFLLLAIALLVCAGCFVSCDSLMSEVGKTVSVQALDALEKELQNVEFDEFERYDEQEIADIQADLIDDGVALKGEITGGMEGYYRNPETGHWVMQGALGVSLMEDADLLVQHFEEHYATEVSEGRAEIVNGGWLVSITVSSLPLDSETE